MPPLFAKNSPFRARLLWGGIPALVALAAGLWLLLDPSPSAPVFGQAEISIQRVGGGNPLLLRVELAETPAQLAYGLMFRRSLAEDAGMLFLFAEEKPIAMWMKNTYIPLDMLYFRADGTVTKIIRNAEPLSRTMLPSEIAVKGVLELSAGAVARLGLQVGDRLIYTDLSAR